SARLATTHPAGSRLAGDFFTDPEPEEARSHGTIARPMPIPRGRFYVLDGLDGCGKSTQAARLVTALGSGAQGPVLHLREPGSTAAGERIRSLLLDPEPALAPAAQVLLFAAARRQMLEELVAPALAAGRDVVCERFHPSTVAYQGAALGVGEERVLA